MKPIARLNWLKSTECESELYACVVTFVDGTQETYYAACDIDRALARFYHQITFWPEDLQDRLMDF